MEEHEKLVALIRLRDLIYFGVQPTLRQSGLPATMVQQLANEQLIRLGDRHVGDPLDRYVVDKILPAGTAFISLQRPMAKAA